MSKDIEELKIALTSEERMDSYLEIETTKTIIGAIKGLSMNDNLASSMTLRDYFAAKALNGILSNPDDVYGVPIEALAESAYRYADAMLKARNQGASLNG
jgi:hypothetical protein